MPARERLQKILASVQWTLTHLEELEYYIEEELKYASKKETPKKKGR